MIEDVDMVEVISVGLDIEDYEKISKIVEFVIGKNHWSSRGYVVSMAVKRFLNEVENEGVIPVLVNCMPEKGLEDELE